jgi:hypothetical protein
VRDFLAWFDAKRRGYFVVQRIRTELERAGLTTFPDFETAWIDAPIGFILSTEEEGEVAQRTEVPEAGPPDTEANSHRETEGQPFTFADPAYRIGQLQAANQRIISAKPDSTIT